MSTTAEIKLGPAGVLREGDGAPDFVLISSASRGMNGLRGSSEGLFPLARAQWPQTIASAKHRGGPRSPSPARVEPSGTPSRIWSSPQRREAGPPSPVSAGARGDPPGVGPQPLQNGRGDRGGEPPAAAGPVTASQLSEAPTAPLNRLPAPPSPVRTGSSRRRNERGPPHPPGSPCPSQGWTWFGVPSSAAAVGVDSRWILAPSPGLFCCWPPLIVAPSLADGPEGARPRSPGGSSGSLKSSRPGWVPWLRTTAQTSCVPGPLGQPPTPPTRVPLTTSKAGGPDLRSLYLGSHRGPQKSLAGSVSPRGGLPELGRGTDSGCGPALQETGGPTEAREEQGRLMSRGRLEPRSPGDVPPSAASESLGSAVRPVLYIKL